MFIDLVDDPTAFRSRVASFFAGEPISTNVIATVNREMTAKGPASSPEALWVVVNGADGGTVGAAMANEPWNLFVSSMSTATAEAIADRFHLDGRSLPGVSGEERAATAFADRWRKLTGCQMERTGKRRVYVLDELIAPTNLEGSPRRFTTDEVPLAVDWLGRFHAEAVPEDPAMDWAELATRRIHAGEIWGWDVHGEAVAMAACSQPAEGIARVGPVYTPPEHRGRGYAAGATAAATRTALEGGAKRIMLYADAANMTSNALYQRLGFHVDHEAVQYRFEPLPT